MEKMKPEMFSPSRYNNDLRLERSVPLAIKNTFQPKRFSFQVLPLKKKELRN